MTSSPLLPISTAVRRFCIHQRIHFGAEGLLVGHLDAERHCIGHGQCRISHCFAATRCHQGELKMRWPLVSGIGHPRTLLIIDCLLLGSRCSSTCRLVCRTRSKCSLGSSQPATISLMPSTTRPPELIKLSSLGTLSFESKVGGMTLVRDLIRNEGATAFFKGLTPKVRTSHGASPSVQSPTGPESGARKAHRC